MQALSAVGSHGGCALFAGGARGDARSAVLCARGRRGHAMCWIGFEVLEGVRYVPLCMLEAVEGVLCLLEVLEVMRC